MPLTPPRVAAAGNSQSAGCAIQVGSAAIDRVRSGGNNGRRLRSHWA
jgi:hypothetical protein